MRIAWYRTKITFAHRLSGYISLALLVGLVGGVAMGSVAAARRTQSAYPEFLASTNPSNLFFSSFGTGGPSGANNARHSVTSARIARLKYVRRVASVASPLVAPLLHNGAPDLSVVDQLSASVSIDGEFFNQDRLAIVQGRMANPAKIDEFVANEEAAHLLDLHVGQSVAFGTYSVEQTNSPGFGTPKVKPRVRVLATLVGIGVPNDEVVEDDVDSFQAEVLFTPAFAHRVIAYSTGSEFGLQLVGGDRNVPHVEQELSALVPPGTVYEFHQTSLIEDRVERVMRPDSIALGVFGAIAGLATLVLAALAISRQLQAAEPDLEILRDLGAGPISTSTDGLLGVLCAALLGTLLAMAVAILVSPLAPIGPIRRVYPTTGFAVDWTVIGIGALVLFGGLAAVAGLFARRIAPHRTALRSRSRSSSVVSKATEAGLPVPAVIGVRFALEPGASRTAVPVRSAMIGAAVAVLTVVATLTFWSGLHTLVTQPALFGWNWNYLLYPGNQNIPQEALTLLQHDRDVAAASGVSPEQAQLDGQEVPILIGRSDPDPAPPILSGHEVRAANQIVLGEATLRQLDKHIGDIVVLTYGAPQNAPIYVPPTRLRIVGTATFPAIGYPSDVADHTSMGTGAYVSVGVEPAALRKAETNPDPLLSGPSMVLVRDRAGVSPAAGHADLSRVVATINKMLSADPNAAGDSIALLGVQRPAEIVNYQSLGSTPIVLAVGLAFGAMVALALTLSASAWRRRRDLALLKALGFTHRQLAAAVGWQASVTAVIGVVVGVPIGIAIGRELWTLFANDIYAVPEPTVPVLSIVLVCLGAIVLSNVVAVIPGRIAARTPVALVFRAD